MFILIEESKKKKLPKGQHYFHELIDFDIYSDNELIGKVAAFENYGGDDLIKIKTLNGEDKHIPYRKEFVEKIDEKEKRVYVKMIDGLI
jgi:ribosomal 30S subunit maturation factor RimM